MAIVAPVPAAIAAVIDQFDLGFAAIGRGVGRRCFQVTQDAACAGHARDGVDRPDGRRHGGSAGKTQNAGKECSSIHYRNLQFPRPSGATMAMEAERGLNKTSADKRDAAWMAWIFEQRSGAKLRSNLQRLTRT
jgi:hypothetical protein